jgi:hypothetical protein
MKNKVKSPLKVVNSGLTKSTTSNKGKTHFIKGRWNKTEKEM